MEERRECREFEKVGGFKYLRSRICTSNSPMGYS